MSSPSSAILVALQNLIDVVARLRDPEAEYIRRWLPELARCETLELLTGKLSDYQRRRLGYVPAIVDHNQQQREFKRRYQALKT